MVKLFFILASVFSMIVLSACATGPTISVPEIVKVPVTVYCKITPVQKPDLPFNTQAKTSMTLYEKVQLLLAQDQVREAYEIELEGALAGCAAPSDSDSNLTTK
jgi:hypothetical protein